MKSAVFLDRDGVINKPVIINGKPYPPASLEELEILPGVEAGIDLLKTNGFAIFVITNQPDVARGKVSIDKVQAINDHLKFLLSIDEVYCCFHDDIADCNCRKPKPGMLLKASEDWQLSISECYMIGDRWRDIEAGKRAGVKKSILIDYDYNEKKVSADYECRTFSEAVNYILANKPQNI
jgi:D-glycero-D-manno-heptose 1,7-bisphosphate phosphatase